MYTYLYIYMCSIYIWFSVRSITSKPATWPLSSKLQRVEACCGVLLCVAACCGVLLCVAV